MTIKFFVKKIIVSFEVQLLLRDPCIIITITNITDILLLHLNRITLQASDLYMFKIIGNIIKEGFRISWRFSDNVNHVYGHCYRVFVSCIFKGSRFYGVNDTIKEDQIIFFIYFYNCVNSALPVNIFKYNSVRMTENSEQ